jgi:hypothetical protein
MRPSPNGAVVRGGEEAEAGHERERTHGVGVAVEGACALSVLISMARLDPL